MTFGLALPGRGTTPGQHQAPDKHVLRGPRLGGSHDVAAAVRLPTAHQRSFQLHLTGDQRRLQLPLRSMDHVEHEADADDNLGIRESRP